MKSIRSRFSSIIGASFVVTFAFSEAPSFGAAPGPAPASPARLHHTASEAFREVCTGKSQQFLVRSPFKADHTQTATAFVCGPVYGGLESLPELEQNLIDICEYGVLRREPSSTEPPPKTGWLLRVRRDPSRFVESTAGSPSDWWFSCYHPDPAPAG